MNNFFDNSKLKEKILDIILPLEVVYKEDKGESSSPQIRHGRLNDDLYLNRKVINTRYGLNPIRPRIKMYFKAFMDSNSIINLDVYNNDDNNLFKQFIIDSKNNDFSIKDMKSICDDIITIVNDENEETVIRIIEYIRNKENLKFKEIAQ